MCGVIVVDAGRNQSSTIGHDACIHDHCLGYRHNYLKFYQLPNNNLFTHRMLFFSREATCETYGPRVSFSYYLPLQSWFRPYCPSIIPFLDEFFHELNTLDACWIAVDVWSNSNRCMEESVY